jgi:integrase
MQRLIVNQEKRRIKMALMVECPQCRKRRSSKSEKCECGFSLRKHSGKIYWIDYRVNGKRKREKIGRSKDAAENRLRQVETQIIEERYIDKDKNARVNLKSLCDWYLELEDVKAKKSYQRDVQFIDVLLRILDGYILVKDLTIGLMEEYRVKRLREPSPIRTGETIAPATVNKEVSCLVTILNKGLKHDKISSNPISGIKKLKENNGRNRTLTDDEFETLLENCPEYMKGIILVAFYQAMRQKEILTLTWDSVDLQKGFIRLKAENTKTGEKRSIPIHPRVKEMFQQLPLGIRSKRVFLKNGEPMIRFEGHTRRDFEKALKKSGIEDFWFHDFRHCAITNLWISGENPALIMAIAGHSALKMNLRYANPTENDLVGIKWKNPNGGHLYGHQNEMKIEKVNATR